MLKPDICTLLLHEVLDTAAKVAKQAGPLAGPALKTYLLSYGVPPLAVDAVAGQVLKGAGISPGPLGFQVPPRALEHGPRHSHQ